MINKTNEPLLISDEIGLLLSLQYNLKPSVKILIVNSAMPVKIPNNYQEVFIFNSKPEPMKIINQNYDLSLVYNDRIKLWSVEKTK